MKLERVLTTCAMALAFAAAIGGCKDDTAAVEALQELTGQLSQQAADLNEELTMVSAQIQSCMKDLAKARDGSSTTTVKDASVEVPSIEGEVSVSKLESLKQSLNETIATQKDALADLKEKAQQCAEDLEAARAEAKAAAAKKRAEEKKRKAEEEKPTAVREAEKKGTPKSGTRSRY